jgi:hypothetical protein
LPESGHPGDRGSRWSRLGVAAQIATIAGVPIAVAGIVLAAMALESKDNGSESNSGQPSQSGSLTAQPSRNPGPSQASVWERDQGRLCQEMNRQAAANPASPSPDLSAQLPTLRAASGIIGEFVVASSNLEAPESDHDQVQVMLGHWSEAAALMTGMVRSAEQGNAATFNQRFDEFNESMELGMQVARDLGAVQCT